MKFAISLLILLHILFLIPSMLVTHGQQQAEWLTYENPDYGIGLKYPSDWIKQENNLPPGSPVGFMTSEPNIFELPNATLAVYVYPSSSNVSSLEEYVSVVKARDSEKIQQGGLRLVNSSYTHLSGLPAWSEVVYDYETDRSIKTLITLTLSNNQVYELDYRAQPGEYDRYLPTIQTMIDSFQITNNSNIASAEQQRLLETNQLHQANTSELSDQLYNQCLDIADKKTCDFMFQK